MYIPRGWTYETSTNASFLEHTSVHVALLAQSSAVSWETVMHAAIIVPVVAALVVPDLLGLAVLIFPVVAVAPSAPPLWVA